MILTKGHGDKIDMSSEAITARLRQVSALASDLRPETRLDGKIDMSSSGITARLREVSDLLAFCERLGVKHRPE